MLIVWAPAIVENAVRIAGGAAPRRSEQFNGIQPQCKPTYRARGSLRVDRARLNLLAAAVR